MTVTESAVIPTVDIEGFLAGDRDAEVDAAARLADALQNVGFFYLTGHGIGWELVAEMYDWTKRFHDLPLDQKETVDGYLPLGGGTMRTSSVAGPVRKPDMNESFGVRGDRVASNNWPDLPGFKEAALRYHATVKALGWEMLQLVAVSLDLPREYFLPFFDSPEVGGMRLSHYPAMEYEEDQYGFNAHTDGGFLTFLPNNDVPGLWLRPEGSDWVMAPPLEGAFVMNAGDMLQAWSNGRYHSTIHRVINPPGVERYAMPLFYGPRDDAVIYPVPTCIDAEHPARYAMVVWGERSRLHAKENYGIEIS